MRRIKLIFPKRNKFLSVDSRMRALICRCRWLSLFKLWACCSDEVWCKIDPLKVRVNNHHAGVDTTIYSYTQEHRPHELRLVEFGRTSSFKLTFQDPTFLFRWSHWHLYMKKYIIHKTSLSVSVSLSVSLSLAIYIYIYLYRRVLILMRSYIFIFSHIHMYSHCQQYRTNIW